MTTDIRAFQIFYNDKTRASLDPAFDPLDNSSNERPDWYEYWPIRKYLKGNKLDNSSYYGFFSPLFFAKTDLTGAQVRDFARASPPADVVTFSPFPCHGACFLNVFEHGEFFHRGLAEVASLFFREVDPKVSLEAVVTHSRNTVFSNFFVARRPFWEVWVAVFDRMFEMAETPGSPLQAQLNRSVEYVKETGERSLTHMKIFVMERAVSFLLASRAFSVRNFPPFQLPLSAPFIGHLADVVALDALKIAFSQTGDPHFIQLFKQVRDKAIARAWMTDPREKPAKMPA